MTIYTVGEKVENNQASLIPTKKDYRGEYVTLSPCSPENDLDDLYQASHGSEENLSVWTYMPLSGPFTQKEAMRHWLTLCKEHKEFIFFTVRDNESGKAIGMISFVGIVPEMRRIEVGFIWYSPKYQKSKINTESIFLMLSEVFDNLNYRRVEWKCDSLNAKSRAAAKRLGFSFEGIFKKHMIVNDRNRDTAWFSITDDEWPEIKKNMEKWLYANEDYESLSILNHSQERIR